MNKSGIALSGGGARGAAHIGVLQALFENDIHLDNVSGTSAGSIVGALYCKGYEPLEILRIAKTPSFTRIFKIGLINRSFTQLSYLESFLEEHLKEDSFDALKIPFHVCVSNINSGKFEIISEGKIIKYLMASCAFPLLFNPITINGSTYIDGGLLNNLPIEPLLGKCNTIIGVSLCPHEHISDFKGRRSIAIRCMQLGIWNTVQLRLAQCDISIEIEKAYSYGMFEIKKTDTLFEIGYETTMARIPEIKRELMMK